jgi:predicted dehydrogenase
VPHHLHAPLSIQASQAGKHVIIEKPMAANLAEADNMLAAACQAGVHLAVLYCQRYLPYVQRAKALIDQGALGKILGATFLLYQDKPISYYTSGFSGRANTDWRLSKEKSGGGILIFNMVHYLDIFRYLTGLEVVRAFGDFGPLETPLETEDTIAVTMRYDNQAIGSLTASAVVRGAPYQPQLRIWGSDGQLVLTEPDQHIFYSLRQIGDFRPGQWHSLGQLPMGGDRQEFITRFAGAILRGETPEMSAASGRAVQAIVEAIYRSGEVGGPVALSTLNRSVNEAA